MNPSHTDADDDDDTTPVDDQQHTNPDDDDVTPADTKDDPKTPAEKAKDVQKKSFLDKLESGELESTDDIPKNLKWLHKDDPDFDQYKPKPKPKSKPKPKAEAEGEDLDAAVDRRLDERDAKVDYGDLVKGLAKVVTAEQDAALEEEYEYQMSGIVKPTYVQRYKALETARKIVGIKDVSEHAEGRRRSGKRLMPQGGKKRNVAKKEEQLTEMEKKFSDPKDLPKGYHPSHSKKK